MAFYNEASKELCNKLKPYIKFTESIKVSENIELNGKMYREVKFNKKSLLKFRRQITGYLYITDKGEIVNQKPVQEKLAKMSYFAGVLLDDENKGSFIKALQNEGEMNRSSREYERAIEAIDFLISEGFDKAGFIKGILEKLPKLRERSNESIEEVINSAKAIKENKSCLNEESFSHLYDSYTDVMKLNFNKVILIASGVNHYDDIKEKATKTRKKMTVRYNTKISVPLYKLEESIAYFKRIVRAYSRVINMSTPQYVKHLKNVEKDQIEARLSLVKKK